jgi:hypothetical protein
MSDGAAADGGLWSASLSYKPQSSSARDEKNAYPGTLVNGPMWFIAN